MWYNKGKGVRIVKEFDEFIKFCESEPSKFGYDAISSIPSTESYRGMPTNLTKADMVQISKMQVNITKKMLKRYHEWLNAK